MLTPHDLAVLRTALHYFREELSPHGPTAIAPYLAEPLPEPCLTGQSIDRLHARLASCTLSWARCSPHRKTLLDGALLAPTESVLSDAQSDLAAVLIPGEEYPH
jgi:hypothetical protein